MNEEDEKYRSAFGKVLYKYFLKHEGMKIITQKRLAERSGVDQTVISRMVSVNSIFPNDQTLYDDMHAIFKALVEMVGVIPVNQAEELIKTIPADNLSNALRRKLLFTLTNEKIIKPIYKTLQNLPFIGRDEDIQKILDKLQSSRFGHFQVGSRESAASRS